MKGKQLHRYYSTKTIPELQSSLDDLQKRLQIEVSVFEKEVLRDCIYVVRNILRTKGIN